MRGYFGIGIYHPKNGVNIGTLWRSAYIFGAGFIFTIGRRYKKQSSDTVCAYRHVPLFHFQSIDEFRGRVPYAAQVVCVEICDKARGLAEFKHPPQAVYLLGAEDYGLPEEILHGNQAVTIPAERRFCLNVATAGAIVMYDRHTKTIGQPPEILDERSEA